MKLHKLKTWLTPFNEVKRGRKTAEFRKNDRNFQLWDLLLLRAWDEMTEKYTGSAVLVQITHLARYEDDPTFGIPEGYAMLSFRVFDNAVVHN